MKMSKIFLSLATASLIMLCGCKKNPLDITPDGRITIDDVFKDEIKTEAFLNTVYGQIPHYFYSYDWLEFLAGITDEAQDARGTFISWMMPQRWISGGLTTTYNPIFPLDYPTWWRGINYANLFLANIDQAKISNESYRSRLKGEAQILRAFFYWELIKQFGAMPVVKEPFAPGYDFASLVRPDFQTSIDFIISECDDIINNPNVPMRLLNENERGRFPKSVAYAIKSEALLFAASPLWNSGGDVAKWARAATASKEALQALTQNGEYALAADYESYFQKTQDLGSVLIDRETIHEIPGTNDMVFSVINAIPGTLSGGTAAGAVPSQELVDSYDMQATGEPAILGYNDEDHLQPIINPASGYDENNPYVGRDPRFYATVWYNGAYYGVVNGDPYTIDTYIGGRDQLLDHTQMEHTRTGYYLRKFYDPSVQGYNGQSSRFKKFRLAEIYLNLAEAENEANGPTQDAYDAVNEIRKRAHMPLLPGGLTQDQLRDRIRRERRVEFAFEENRFWDTRRWKTLNHTDKLVTGMRITKNGNGSFSYTRFVTERRNAGWQDKYLVFPIPLNETNLIPDFSAHQNPGW